MKTYNKYALLLIIGLVTAQNTKACDFCGCGVGSYYFGAMPMFHKNALGMRYRSMEFSSHLGSPFESKEHFGISELFFRLYPHRRWQVVGFLPYANNSQQVDGQTKRLSGLADALALVSFNLYNNMYDSSSWKHNLFIGTGIKLPTGKYTFDKNDRESVANENFQLGSGSTDLLFNTLYSLRKGKWGLNTTLSYKLNTVNSQNYRFGNRVSIDVSIMRIQKLSEKFALAPYLGFYGEKSQRDERNGYFVDGTGGHLVLGNVGLDAFVSNRFTIGVLHQMPFNQHLSEGKVRAERRWMIQMAWLF